MWLFVGSTFYSSLIYKKAPGTVSSLVIFLLLHFLNPLETKYKIACLLIIGLCHFMSFPYFQKKYQDNDPRIYTLDETFAIFLLNIFVFSPGEWIVAFFLFRFFDILKPVGIKRFEEINQIPYVIKNVGDDVIAAIYTGLVIMGLKYVI